MIDILSLNLNELKTEILNLNEPEYRAKQIFEWLHKKKATNFDEITVLSKQFKEKLKEKFCIKSLNIQKRLVSNIDDTVKYLYMSDDGIGIETVYMEHNHGNSLCISTQAGCRMGCRFCASKEEGFERNLTPSELLLQLYVTEIDLEKERKVTDKECKGAALPRLRRYSSEGALYRSLNSIVLMGVGEPLDNFDNVMKFLELLQSGHGMSLRHVSLSTCGLVPQIKKLAGLKLGLTLSVSLHASNDEDRNRLMPVNNKYNLNALLNSCSDYFKDTSRRISFEYSLIDGVNDSVQNAYELSRLLKKFMPNGSFHVNLIPVNSIAKERLCRDRAGTALQGRCTEVKEETAYKKSENIKAFSEILEKERINVTTRRSLGGDINAACGQLRLRRTIDN